MSANLHYINMRFLFIAQKRKNSAYGFNATSAQFILHCNFKRMLAVIRGYLQIEVHRHNLYAPYALCTVCSVQCAMCSEHCSYTH